MIWPFKPKMTVDYCASLYAQAIAEDLKVYGEALRSHAAENITEDRIEELSPELWAIELAVLEAALVLGNFPPSMRGPLIAMLVVGYSPLDKEAYAERGTYYAKAVASGPAEQFTVALGKAFVAASGIKYKAERTDVNRAALEWAISSVATGSFQALGNFTANVAKKHKIY
jgi:hypothetical protein